MGRTDSTKKIMKFDTEDNAAGVETYIGGYSGSSRKIDKKFVVLLTLAIILLVVGIVLIVLANSKLSSCDRAVVETSKKTDAGGILGACYYSGEATRLNLGTFMKRVIEEYHDAFPEETAYYPNADVDRIKMKFKVHDPTPQNIKAITERANKLLKEVRDLNPTLSKLKPREHRAYLQLVHFLENTFANSNLNFSTGLWMLGPSSFCVEPMCYVGYGIYNSVGAVTASSIENIEFVLANLKSLNQSLYDYVDVLKMGISKGMVRTQVECLAGIDAMKSKHRNVSENGARGVLNEWYVRRFRDPSFYLRNQTGDMLNEHYVNTTGKNISDVIDSALLDYIGKPVEYMLTYLTNDHLLHCRPDNYSAGGLSALPIDVVFYNGSIVNKSDPYLPLCDRTKENCRLNGSMAYQAILGYYTTKNIHPDEVHELGWENLRKLYPQVLDIAQRVTNVENDTVNATLRFREILTNLSSSFFNTEPIPENETRGEAFLNCNNEVKAKKNCPNRWSAMMKWFEFAQMAMSIHDPNTIDFFYFAGDLHSTPNCPVKLRPDFNPSSGAQSYDSSDPNCTVPCYYNIPFFLENLGPSYSEYSVNAHEARPGHHTQVQGLLEHFRDKCGGPEAWLDSKTYYTAFTEGWGLYAENPLIAQGTNIYADNLMQKFGMLKWQIWRALRLIVDTGLHYKNMTREEALYLFAKYAWDKSDLSKKEVTRYQSNYGQATAYMIGQLDIWLLRNQTEERLGSDYSIKEFHLQALSQGSSPLAYLQSYMEKYISCKKDSAKQYCDIVLNPTKASASVDKQFRLNPNVIYPKHRHYI